MRMQTVEPTESKDLSNPKHNLLSPPTRGVLESKTPATSDESTDGKFPKTDF